MNLKDKVILITGGAGSFGQKFVELALREHNPEAIRIFSRGELLQQEMRQKFNDDERLRFFIGDVRDQRESISSNEWYSYRSTRRRPETGADL